MIKSLKQRLDSQGVFSYNKNGINIGIGMRRLSIIDIESGDQPIFSEIKKSFLMEKSIIILN